MAENNPERAFIRDYKASDEKEVRFMIGQTQMEQLAYANNRVNFNPITMAVWIALSSACAKLIGWWQPNPDWGWMSYVTILPAFFACAVPIMFFIDWNNRPSVEARTENTLRNPDCHDIPAYYARSPASCFSILQYGNKHIGLIALDASTDATNNTPLSKDTKLSAQRAKELFHGKGTSPIATIRHFHSEEAYRSAGIEDDLLQYAIDHAFGAGSTVKTIRISVSPFKKTLLNSLKKMRFTPGEKDGKIGPFGYEWQWYTLDRARWESGN